MSDINYSDINNNFPVAGEDNDTQGFRDNFNTIKQSLQTAKTEVGDLQVHTAKISSPSGSKIINDFNFNGIENASMKNNRNYFYVNLCDETSEIEINYANGDYQILNADKDLFLKLIGFPNTSDELNKFMSKVTIEIHSADDDPKIITVPGDITEIIDEIETTTHLDIITNSSPFWSMVDFDVSFTVLPNSVVLLELWKYGNTIFLHYVDDYNDRLNFLENNAINSSNLKTINSEELIGSGDIPLNSSLELIGNTLRYTGIDETQTDIDLSPYITSTPSTIISGTLNNNDITFTRNDASFFNVDISALYDDTTNTIVSGTLNGNYMTFTREDSSSFDVDVSSLYDDTTNTIISGILNGNYITFTREDSSSFDVDVSALTQSGGGAVTLNELTDVTIGGESGPLVNGNILSYSEGASNWVNILGASGSFTTPDGQTITVTNGIITGISGGSGGSELPA